MCMQEIKRNEIKTHFLEDLRKIQDNNKRKGKDNQEHYTSSTISTIYKIFSEIKALQVVSTPLNTGIKF